MSCRYPESLLLRNWSAMSTNLMKSLRFTEFGPPSVLRIEEVAIPEPGEGEALVQVKAAAINPSDIGNVAGRFKKHNSAANPRPGLCGHCCKRHASRRRRGLGQFREARYRP